MCRAWLRLLYLSSTGAALCWGSDAAAESEQPSPDTFEYSAPTEKNYLRAVLELEALTTVSVVWYVIDVRQALGRTLPAFGELDQPNWNRRGRACSA